MTTVATEYASVGVYSSGGGEVSMQALAHCDLDLLSSDGGAAVEGGLPADEMAVQELRKPTVETPVEVGVHVG